MRSNNIGFTLVSTNILETNNNTNAIKRGKKVRMTEKYYNPDDIATCITMAKEITDCLYYNMNAYVLWYLRQPGCNLIEAGGKLKKKGYTMGQYLKICASWLY